jgi:hypothetical protein
MLVINFFHIKQTNGLFYYGLEYARQNFDLIRIVIVNSVIESRVKAELPCIKVISTSNIRYLLEIVKCSNRNDLLYTPTSHPIPFLNWQWIVLHDAYPFKYGLKAKLKYFLFKLSLSTSRCRVGYINRSEAKPFVESLGVVHERLVFAPNRFPKPALLTKTKSLKTGKLIVGLLGTDSEKKNYAHLFNEVRKADHASRLVFRAFGHETAYFRNIQANFPDVMIELVRSDVESIEEFMGGVDVLASASEYEGFGRPFASALLAGISVELLDRPVFREFFNGGAHFHPDLESLVQSLVKTRKSRMRSIEYSAPIEVVNAYVKANEEIRLLGSITIN